MKIRDLDLKYITLIQVGIATFVTSLFQFVFPFNWQPLDRFTHGEDIVHGEHNYVFFTISQWLFSFSISWLVYRDNPYVNNFLVYAVVFTGPIIFTEVFVLGLFWDYIHATPFIVGILIFWKKKETLRKDWFRYYFLETSIWYFTVYFLKLAYYRETLINYVFKYILLALLAYGFTFTFKIKLKRKKETQDILCEDITL